MANIAENDAGEPCTDEQDEIASKIELLFGHGTDESKLAAVVLCIQSWHPPPGVEWMKTITANITIEWCRWFLSDQKESSLTLLLLVRFLRKAVRADLTNRQFVKWIDGLGSLLATCIEGFKFTDVEESIFLYAIHEWMDRYCRKAQIVNETLLHIADVHLVPAEKCNNEMKEIDCKTPDREEEEDDDDEEGFEALQSALRIIVLKDQPQPPRDEAQHEEFLQRIFVRGFKRIVRAGRGVPLFVDSLVPWWLDLSNTKKQTERRTTVTYILLRTVELAPSNLLERTKLTNAVCCKMLLASVINNNAHQQPLRSLAWAALLTRSQNAEWKSFFLTSSNQSTRKLGKATFLCTVTRLAVGECKIQLEVTTGTNEELLEVCSHFLVHIVNFLAELEENMDNYGSCFPGDAILHLQRSLEEAMTFTAEYLVLVHCNRDKPSVFALRLFGTLLTEMDAFRLDTGSENNDPFGSEANLSSNGGNVLLALRVALEHTSDDTSHGHLLRGLLAVFLSAQDDEVQMQMLRDEKITESCTTHYLVSFFSTTDTWSLIGWACQVLEWQFSFCTINETATLQDSMLMCLERLLEQPTSRELATQLSQIVGTYALLQGDSIPNDEKAAYILEKAFEHSQQY